MSLVTDDVVFAYFSSLGSLAKKIVEDEERIRHEYGLERWNHIELSKRDEILDEWLVKQNVLDRYEHLQEDGDNHTESYHSYFPRFITRPGGKYVAPDSELDLEQSGWQDEHSAPFTWRSKSQEDLSFADLDFSSKDRGRQAKLPPSPAVAQGDNMPRPNPWRPGHNMWDSPNLASYGYTDSGYPSSQGSKHSSLEDVPVAMSNDTSMETETDGDLSMDSQEAVSVAVRNCLQVGVNPSFVESSEDVSRMAANVPPVILPRPRLDKSSTPSVSIPRIAHHPSEVSTSTLSHGEVNRAYTDTDSDRKLTDTQKSKTLEQKETAEWSKFVGEEQEIAIPAVAPSVCTQEHEDGREETSFSHTELTTVQHSSSPQQQQLLDEPDTQISDDIPKSGFDFLDNW